MNSLQYFAILLLVPLVPAIVLYKMLPTQKADVSGTFQGMKIKLGGAIAFYFVLVLIGYARLPAPPPIPVPQQTWYEVWKVKGAVTGADPDLSDYERDLLLRVNPFGIKDKNGGFQVEVLRKFEEPNWVFPRLNVELPGYYGQSVDLNDQQKVEYDQQHRLITIRRDFALKAKATPTPTPTSTPH